MRRPSLLLLAAVITTLSVSCADADPPTVNDNDAAEAPETPTPRRDDQNGNDGKKKARSLPPEWDGPNFKVTTFEGETYELAAQAGRPVVLNFWESW